MKGQSLTERDKEFILANKEKMFKNQIAVALSVNQATVRRFLQRTEKETDD